jgi:hypothetical protein
MSQDAFQRALHKLVTDMAYNSEVATDPQRLIQDFELTSGELGLLTAVWAATGRAPETQTQTQARPMLCHWSVCCCTAWE